MSLTVVFVQVLHKIDSHASKGKELYLEANSIDNHTFPCHAIVCAIAINSVNTLLLFYFRRMELIEIISLHNEILRRPWIVIRQSCPIITLRARFMGPVWGPSGADRTQMAPCWPHELCYRGSYLLFFFFSISFPLIKIQEQVWDKNKLWNMHYGCFYHSSLTDLELVHKYY